MALIDRARDATHAVRVLARAGVVGPVRPDRLVRSAGALRRYGPGVAAGIRAAAARHPDRLAVVDERGEHTWADLDRRTDAIAGALAADGLRPGETVGVMCRNHAGFVEIIGALAKLGAHDVLANTGFAAPQLDEVLAREGASAVVVDAEFADLVPGDAPAATGSARKRYIAWPDPELAPGIPTLDELAARGHPAPPPPPDPGRMVILTSGTTGTPKGAPRAEMGAVGVAVAILDRIPYRNGEVMMNAAPLFHAWGFGNFAIGLLLGATTVLTRRFDPEATLAAVARHRATCLVAVPVMLQRILELPPEARRAHDVSSLRIVPLSGSAIPAGLAERWMDAFGDNVYNLYGSTEVGWASIATPEDLRAAPGTAGRPPRGTTLRILDEDGRPVPTGQTGRIFVSSDLTFEGYTDGTSKDVVDGVMSTGDTGHLDTDGRLFVEGRADEMIVSGGENVFPREVEDHLATHEDIVEAAVVGVADDEFGQRLRAYVVRRPGAAIDADAVREHVRAHLARYKVPRDVEFLDELPRNPTGKVLKRLLDQPGS